MNRQVKHWRLMVDGRLPAAVNMAVDEALFRLCSSGNTTLFPVVRFYQWEHPTLSFGSSQEYERTVDLDYCRRTGYDVIRRPTGGRAVLHDDEVTYSVIGRAGSDFGNSIQETYRVISGAIIEGLKELGVSAETYGKEGAGKTGKLTYLPCFASSTRYEVAYKGKKIVGSAQRRNNTAFLQHGSILMSFNSKELLKAIGSFSEKSEDPANYMISISEILNIRVLFGEVVQNLAKGFEKYFGVRLEKSSLSRKEEKISQFFSIVKYQTDYWNFCR